jgi:hypothetical protein
MHGSNPLDYPVRIDWGPAGPLTRGSTDPRSWHFIRTPQPDAHPDRNEAFLAGGIIPPSGELSPDAREDINGLMSRLEARMWQMRGDAGELWQDKLESRPGEPEATAKWENPSLPAGYTYLLQLIAHDMVDTVRSAVIGDTDVFSPNFRNARRQPLMLDTIYGDGPEEAPHAYKVDGSNAAVPRTLLRTGNIRQILGANEGDPPQDPPPPVPRRFCPFKDIARSRNPEGGARMTEVMLADPRNDAHAIVSQLTVLFHLLHNAVMELLPPVEGALKPEIAFRQFLCARFAVTLIYRNVIEKDVLPRILNERVLAAYRDNPSLQIDEGGRIPIEFSAGAFRFGHTLVRETYRANSAARRGGLPFGMALNQSARRNSRAVPVDRFWAVDWSLFFGSGPEVNLARRIGPFFSGGLMEEGSKVGFFVEAAEFEGPAFEGRGLPTRDFLTATYSGLWSVAGLSRAVRARLQHLGLDHLNLVPDFDVWRPALEGWLGDSPLATLRNDPPLPFFVMFEAAHDFDAEGRPVTAQPSVLLNLVFPGQGGRRLGPLGSVIVADVIYRALRSQPLGFDETRLSIHERLEKVSAGTLDDRRALDALTHKNGAARRLDTMTDVLLFLEEKGAFLA